MLVSLKYSSGRGVLVALRLVPFGHQKYQPSSAVVDWTPYSYTVDSGRNDDGAANLYLEVIGPSGFSFPAMVKLEFE